ncbi:MAG: serine/threonine protein kinase [Fibromonadaceae bacterium]|jgi:serine/threonine-protein kinase|nr:serine/threonine protein kinase [Fibromonadaceae bacterium]
MKKAKAPEKIGPYSVQDCIGEGSMGEIWLCHDPSLDRMLVVKRMQLALRGYEDLVQRFNREVQVLAAMNHQNIVQVYGYWMEKGLLNLSMEFINGWSLRQILDKSNTFPPWVACSILWGILNALVHTHTRKFVHRDLKPSNIMVDFAGTAKLLDFGVVRIEDQEITIPGTIIGSAAYMSPEQVRGESVTEHSDIFSLGIIAFEMLAGRHPFKEDSAEKTTRNILSREIYPSDFPEDVPPSLRRLVRRMLAKEPSRRANSAYACLKELDSIMSGLPRELSHPLSSWLRSVRKEMPFPAAPRWKKSLPPLAWLAIATGIGLVAGMVLIAVV